MNSNYKRILIVLLLGLGIFFIGKNIVQDSGSSEANSPSSISSKNAKINDTESVWMSEDGKEVYHLTMMSNNTMELKDAKRRRISSLTKSGDQFVDSTYTVAIKDTGVVVNFMKFSAEVFEVHPITGLFTLTENGKSNTFELCDGSGTFLIANTGTYNYLIKRYLIASKNNKTVYVELLGKKAGDNTMYVAYTKKMEDMNTCP